MTIPLIDTARLRLRPFTADDADALFAYASAPQFSHYVEYPSPTTLNEAQAFLQEILLADNPAWLSWAVCLQGAPAVVGTVQLSHDAPDTMSVHYDISHTLYRQGYTTEAVRAVLHWCLAHYPAVAQFLADTTADNIGSQRVLAKCGFTEHRREMVQWEKSPTPVELVYYRALRSDIITT